MPSIFKVRRSKPMNWTPELLAEVTRLREEGWPIIRIAEHIGCKPSQIDYQVERGNIPRLQIYGSSRYSPEQMAEMERRWNAGQSASVIGRAMGLTKNQVIGKVHRMGLKLRPQPIRRKIKTAPIIEPISAAPLTKKADRRSDSGKWPAEPIRLARVTGTPVNGCQWPLWGPDETTGAFCGGKRQLGKPYCPEHCSKAYIGRSAPAEKTSFVGAIQKVWEAA